MGGGQKLFHETQKTTKLASEFSQRPLGLIPGGEGGGGKKIRGSACNGLEQGLGSQSETEAGSQRWAHQILVTSPVVSDKDPGPSALQKRISAKIKSSEASRIFIQRTKSTLRVDRHMVVSGTGRVTELHLRCTLNYFYKAFLPRFLWPITLICLIHSSYLVYLRILTCVHTHLLAKVDFTKKTYA